MASARINIAGRSIYLHVEQGDALRYQSDFLVVKYAQSLYGLDSAVASALSLEASQMPEMGDFRVIDSNDRIAAQRVLFVGVAPLQQFRYRNIREFSFDALRILSQHASVTRRLSITVHGPGYGLDEMECFESLVAGILDGLSSGTFPATLADVAIVERVKRRADAFDKALGALVKNRELWVNPLGAVSLDLSPSAGEKIRAAGYVSDTKPLVFVAMPFREDMMDYYDYGILQATQRAGFVCERADQLQFTGDVMERVKSRIDACLLMVADLSYNNPNVFLEVGYAWGRNKPVIFLKREKDKFEFDVQSQRCLIYKRIKDIEEQLYDLLIHLRPQ